MRLAKARGRDSDELRLTAEVVDRSASDIAHTAAKSADHLKEHVRHGPPIGHSTFDSFGNELLRRQLAFLEVTIGAAVLHRGKTPHAAHHLEATALEEKRLAGTFFGSGEHRSHHH